MQRNWKLTFAILIGVVIGTTLFASANLASAATLNYMLEETLQNVPIDFTYEPQETHIYGYPNSTNLLRYQNTIEGVDGVLDTQVVVSHFNYSNGGDWNTIWSTFGISEDSPAWVGASVTPGAPTLGANETYIMQHSNDLGSFPIGSNYTITIQVYRWPSDPFLINVTFEVVGIIEFTDEGIGHLGGGVLVPNPYFDVNVFIVDLNLTMLPIIDAIQKVPDFQYANLNTAIQIYLDRVRIINPFDIMASIQQINLIEQQIRNELGFDVYIENHVTLYLITFSTFAENQKFTFLLISMPIFFIALYVGITLNDVSFSLRRREVGLYLTKGQTRQGITSMFVTEGFVVGILASILGLALALVLVPYFMGSGTYAPLNPLLIGFDTIFLTFAFGIFLAVIATYWPARKAVQIPTTEAIREYTLAGEPTGYNKALAWTCLILGTYKLVIWIFGINVASLFLDIVFTNPILSIAVSIWLLVDSVLGFWAPLLFFYGFTIILVKGSTRFHDYATRFIRRIMGDLGAVAAHTIRRRPGRTAAVIFITTLLVGYSVQTVGIIAAQQDLVIRSVYKNVGADLKVDVQSINNITNMLDAIRAVPGVGGATFEFTFSMQTTAGSTQVRAINVSEWINVAFWEPEWFPIQPAHFALQQLDENNQSIILERLRAVELDIELGNFLSVDFPVIGFQSMQVVGYFGPEPENLGSWGFSYWLAEPTWSYISYEHYQELRPGLSSESGYILVALQNPAFNEAVVSAIEALDDVESVESSLETLSEFNTDVFLNANINMMYMGLLFAFLLASLGTAVVVFLTLRERRTSTALMSARGMTYGQTIRTLIAETLTIIGFAIVVGLLVGLIVLYGSVRGAVGGVGAIGIPTLLVAHILPVEFVGLMAVQLIALLAVLLGATLIPILIEAYTARYDTSILR
ncbi:MAG: FtsX-like permease family protein [Promethearchaeota archaeon]